MTSIRSFFDNVIFCKSPLFIPINPNSTVSEAITPCFAFVFLPTILAAFSISCLIFLIFYGFIILSPKLAVSKLLITKTLFAGVTVLAAVARLILVLFEPDAAPEAIIGRVAVTVIAVTSLASYFRCWHRGIPSSIWLHLIYFLRLISIIPEAIVVTSEAKPHFASFVFLGVEAISVFFLNILFCFVDKFHGNYENFSNQKPVDPDRTRSSLARAVFAQAGHLMSKGYKGTLDYDSFWSLDPRNQPERLLILFNKHYAKAQTTKKPLIPWLFFVLMKATWFPVTAAALLTIIFALMTISDPLFLKFIIDSTERNYPLWYGLTLVIASLIVGLGKFILSARSDFYGLLGYLDVQSILMNAIYRKMLKLSASAKLKYSAGEVVNLLSTDVERIRYFWLNLMDFFYSPLMVIICLTGLSFTIGINILYGVGVIILFLPLNSILVKIATTCEQRQMDLKDERLKLMTDVLAGVKVLKLYAWEASMRKRIDEIRTKEVTQLKYTVFCYAFMDVSFSACPIIATILSFVGYIIIQGHPLTPQVAFLSLMLFNLMRFSVFRIPGLIQEVVNARISLNRVQEFLLEPEVPKLVNSLVPSSENTVVELQDASFSWSPVNPEAPVLPVLKSLTLDIRDGELIGIVGRVGAGKSSLLSSICGELYQTSGLFYRRSPVSIAYVPQEAWIQNLSLRDNILFGKSFEETLYRQTIDVCALKDDLKMFAAGDATEIGERGLNLSGGQKARVALARAVYQNSDLYILDDTLSAVDSHVGAHIFQNVIGNEGVLKNKTRIFALNSISFLTKCDRIVVMKEGNIVDVGTYVELLARENETFAELVKEFAIKSEKEIKEDAAIDEEEEDVLNELVGAAQIRENNRSISTGSNDLPSPVHRRRRTSSNQSTSAIPSFHRSISHQTDVATGRLVEDEELASGKVSYKMYLDYLKAFGVTLGITYCVVLFGFRTFFESFSQVWMAKWSSGLGNITNTQSLEVYGIFGVASAIASGIASVIIAFGAFRASRTLHDNLLFSLLRSPMSFFDTTPLGRILNRLSKDIEKIDEEVPLTFSYSTIIAGEAIFYTVSALYVIPLLGLLSIPVMVIFVIVVRYYTHTSVQIRRLVSKAWSSVTSHTQDSYVGLNTLRVFAVQDRFSDDMLQKGITAVEANLAEITSNRWIQLRMDLLTSIFATALTAFAVYFGHTGFIAAGSVALVTSTGTMLRGTLGEIARTIKNMEQSIVSVERVQEYVNNEHEAEWTSPIPPPPSWPKNGVIRFKNYSLRYRPNTPLVLKNLNLEIAGGHKVGIVGRTGAGKTSLTMALFRMIEPASGTIIIDNTDFRTLGLHELRQALTIIPQDPVLFCGDLRINLDPFGEFDDATLWEAIEKAHLKKFVDEFPQKLLHEISEGGGNLSVGQRQLVCLARAILRRKTKILVLDEATAAVDVETDQLIQDSIRSHFSQCTILTIAHRLNTIMDYDKVLVMDAGEIREFDSPQKLLENKNGLFYSLASQAKLV